MSDDEVFLGLIALAGSVGSFIYWFRNFSAAPRFARNRSVLRPFYCVIPLCVLFIVFALRVGADDEVTHHFGYMSILTGLGFFWFSGSTVLCSWCGVSCRDDAFELRNPAAVIALSGWVVAITFIYSGGSMGEGPSLWNNVFSAAVGTVTVFLLWFVLELFSSHSKAIAEERDIASGVRLAGFLIAVGLVLGRSLAGTWESAEGTVRDMIAQSWPTLILLMIAIIFGRALRPNRVNPFPSWKTHGIGPALFYITVASAYVCWLGMWE